MVLIFCVPISLLSSSFASHSIRLSSPAGLRPELKSSGRPKDKMKPKGKHYQVLSLDRVTFFDLWKIRKFPYSIFKKKTETSNTYLLKTQLLFFLSSKV